MKQHRVFISYSRRDENIARKMVELGRAFGTQPWRDESDIRPGDDWRAEIATSIASCDRVMLLWCRHSERSSEVRNEYLQALDLRKRICPVKLDRATLPPELDRLQAVDVSGWLWWSHQFARQEVRMAILGATCLAAGGLLHVFL